MTPPVVQLALVYGAGLWVGLVVLVPLAFVLPMGLAVAGWRGRPPGWRAVLLVAAVVAFGVGRLQRAGQACTQLDRGPVSLMVRTTDPPDQRGRQAARALAGCQGSVTLRVREPLPAGARVLVEGSHTGRGVVAVREHRVAPGRDALIPRFRAGVAERIERLYGPRAPLVEALVLGRKGDIDPALREAFAAAGLAHLLAISGLHVGLIASWVALLMGALIGKRRAWMCAAVFAWVYVLTLGFPAPATRAAAFVTLLGVSRALGRHPPFSAILASAVLVVVLINPTAMTAIGAWMSVTAVWGTAEAARLVRGRHALVKLLAVSVGATLATAPLTAYAFGQVALIGIAANLIAVPLAGIAVPGVFASLVFGAPLAAGAGLALAATERIALVAAAVPGAQVVMTAGVKAAVPWTVLLMAMVWLLRVRPRVPWLLPRLAAVAAVLVWLPVAAPRQFSSTSAQLHVFFLNVGQGDAIAIRTPNNRWLLIDAGPRDDGFDAGRDVVVPFLRRHRVRALEAFFLSHGDMDHVGGAPAVLEAVQVHRVIEPGQALGQGGYRDFLEAAAVAGADWHPGRVGDTLRVDGVEIAVLHPSARWIETELRANENSLVLHVRYGEFDLLLTGDAGLPVEERVTGWPQVEVLKVGHHGSAGSTGAPFLAAVRPKLAVIPVGRNNRYGHPAPAVMTRLSRAGIAIARTDRDGLVTLTVAGQYFQVASGDAPTPLTRVLCALSPSRPSSPSSSTRNACTRMPAGNSPTSFTTWPSPARSSPATSGARD